MPQNATLQVMVYGYDAFVADVSATEIATASFDQSVVKAGARLETGFNLADLQNTEYQSGAEDALRYYVHIDVDTNNDGEICNGDWRRDFDATPLQFFDSTERDVDVDVSLLAVTDFTCPGN